MKTTAGADILSAIPARFTGHSAWLGKDMQESPDAWLHCLTHDAIRELENAAQHHLTHAGENQHVTVDTFPISTFRAHISTLAERLLHGTGVEVLRGLPIADYPTELVTTIFCGIGAHLGSARSQNAQGDLLGHVRDTGADGNDPGTRIYQTRERQTFHTDSADVVGLLCLNNAMQGGQSLLVSAESIYNRMRTERPDLLRKLFDPIATDRRGEIPIGAQPFMEIPVLSWYANKITVFYQRQYIDSAQRFDNAMRLSAEHIQALDMFDAIANDPQLHFVIQLLPGDMQFVYNHSQLHDRAAFTDWPEPARRRHMLRLWLSMPGDRLLPEYFEQRYGSIDIGNRGGICVRGGVT